MSDRSRLLREGVLPKWSAGRHHRVLVGALARVERERRARARRTVVMASALALVLAVLGPLRVAAAAAALARAAIVAVGLVPQTAIAVSAAPRPVPVPVGVTASMPTLPPPPAAVEGVPTIAASDLPASPVTVMQPGGRAGAPSRMSSTDGVEALFEATDAERQRGRPERATMHLARIVEKHRTDPRAALASFSMGRILLEELDRPAEAARAFAEVRVLAPRGPLSEDALSREAEASAKAGQRARATSLAAEYIERYPHGAHVSRVRTVLRTSSP